MRLRLNVLALMAASTVGCSAEDPGTSSPAAPGEPGAGSCGTTLELSSPLRRLTRLEYDNTVRDLLGVELSLSDSFPADAVTGGFSNNAAVLTVSPLLAEKYMEAAEALSAAAVQRLPELLPCDPAAAGEEACARQFAEQFGRRAYRRPLAAPEIDRLMRAYAAGSSAASFASGIELMIQTALQSPGFLYRFEFGIDPGIRQGLVRLSQHEIAARLSYLFWSSMPSEALSAAADAGELGTPEQIAAQARALLDDERARQALPEFYRQWLGLEALAGLSKDPAVHPEFDPALRSAMAAELPAFVRHVLWSADRRLETLLTAPVGFVSGPLSELYGLPPSAATAPELVALDPLQRSGVLTQAAVLAVHALPNQSSPVARGKFVRERLLCQDPPPPPPDLNVTPPEVDPALSTRERFAAHTENQACAVCHELMDPLGFAFESYDALGRFRTSDGGQPIDTSGWIAQSEDIDGPFQNVSELSQKLAGSKQVQDCVATQWFRYAFGRHEGPADACSLAALEAAMTTSQGDLLELLIVLSQSEAFLYRSAVNPEVSP